MQNLKYLRLAIINLMLVISVVTYSKVTFATCSFASGYTTRTDNLNFGSVVVQRDTPVGTLIFQGQQQGSTYINCTGDVNTNYYTFSYNGAVSSGISHVYNTNIPGVGVSVYTWAYYDNPAGTDNTTNGAVKTYIIKYNLIKTGAITSGVLMTGKIGTWTVTGITPLIINVSGGNVTQVACAITTPSLNFPLGDVLASSFGSTVGFVNTKTNTQNLGLNCDAGANINVALNGTQNPDVSTNSVLALTGQGNSDVAKGVGVQILYNGSPLVLNNRIVMKQSSGGQETFPITARYYQTKTAVTTGKANASATLDLTYQ